VCLFIFTPEVTVGAFDLSSTSSVLKKELLKIGKIQFAQYQLSDDVDKQPVKRNQRGIYCEDCTYWYHIKCIDLPIDEYQRLSTSSESW
jgi:hypothetical protein